MNTYAIIEDHGYGFTAGCQALTYIEAKSPQAARKEFFQKWAGTYQAADPHMIRATKVN